MRSAMKHLLSPLVLLLSLLMPAAAQAGAPVEGRWHTGQKGGVVEIDVEDGVLRGKLVASKDRRAKLGTVILRRFVKRGGVWVGKIYAPKRDRVVDAKLKLNDGEINIEITAGRMQKSVTWTRVP